MAGKWRGTFKRVHRCWRIADMMALWIAFLVMTVLAASIVLIPIWRRRQLDTGLGGGDIAVYADQLKEVDRDVKLGLIGPSEAEAAKTEISRRILRADESSGAVTVNGSKRAHLLVGAIILLAMPAITIGIYLDLGSPSMTDQPLAARKTTALEQQSPEDLIARLDERLATNPDDLKGWDVAGPIYARMGRYADAVTAFQNAIRLGGSDARREAGLGEALTANAQGVVTSEARAAFERASALEPNLPLPKMYLALALSQDGRLADSVAAWKAVIATGRGYEPWVKAARKELETVEAELAKETGSQIQPVPGSGGASGPAVTGPSMIQSMVQRLRERLDTEGGTPEEWARLIKSYLVLGRTGEAKVTYEKARAAFETNQAASAELMLLVGGLDMPQ